MKYAALCLLALTTTCALQAPSPALRPIPRVVPTRYGPVPVRIVDGLWCGAIKAWGCYHPDTRSIEIEKDLEPVLQWKVLFHELVHSAFHDAQIAFVNPDAENALCDAVAEQRLSEFLAGWPR